MTLGVDVGGTFTDVAMWDGGAMTVGKVPSTPHDQSEGVMAGAGAAVRSDARADLLHGTTVATNALLERRGAKTLLVTDAGFESLIEIARQDRPSLYDPFADRARPLADPEMRLGVEMPRSWPRRRVGSGRGLGRGCGPRAGRGSGGGVSDVLVCRSRG